MKLYYAPHTCSLSPHIVLHELVLPFTPIRVDNRTKQTADGRDFLDINPKGYVAALELEDGRVLTEGPAILQFLADLRPEQGLAPRVGTWERVRLQEWLNFITSEIHAGSAPLFNKALPGEVVTHFQEKLFRRFDFLARTLSVQPYLMGNTFGVADAYLYTVLGWSGQLGIDLERWPVLTEYVARIGSRASVRTALREEAAG